MQHKIAVLDPNLTPKAKARIQAFAAAPINFPKARCQSEQACIEQTKDAGIVIVGPWDKVTASFLDACPALKYVCLCGTSTANINLTELRKRGIAFTNVVDYGDEPAAEFVFMQLAGLLHGVGPYQWKPERHELMGKNVGIVGLGALGKAIAHLALAYKMNVSYYGPHRKPDWEDRGLHYAELPMLLKTNEIIIVSSPTNVEVLSKDVFARMRQGSILVQASAGSVIDQNAFLAWIAREGNFAIFDKSAGDENYHAYKGLPRVIFADVVAGHTHETLERLYEKVVENVRQYAETN